MFKCEHCNQQIAAGISSHLHPIQTKTKIYPKRYDTRGNLIDIGGQGYETVQEITVCPDCRTELESSQTLRILEHLAIY